MRKVLDAGSTLPELARIQESEMVGTAKEATPVK
jgi:hypothetical protein